MQLGLFPMSIMESNFGFLTRLIEGIVLLEEAGDEQSSFRLVRKVRVSRTAVRFLLVRSVLELSTIGNLHDLLKCCCRHAESFSSDDIGVGIRKLGNMRTSSSLVILLMIDIG